MHRATAPTLPGLLVFGMDLGVVLRTPRDQLVTLAMSYNNHLATNDCLIVGPSGAGKSSLVHLIPRFYDATDGQVLILDQGKRTLGFLIGEVAGVETLAPPDEDPKAVVRGVASGAAGAVTVLGAEALASEAERLFGGR